MDVATGSLDEGPQERGFAHFVEHMAFNGSTHVPEGEMIRLLERNGLSFGADTNAQTGFEQTLYMLDLPRADPALLDTALMLMRETASELTFAPAVARERGVVLSELRDGQGYQRANLEDQLAFLYPHATYPPACRSAPSTLDAATADALRSFWAALRSRQRHADRDRRFRCRCRRSRDPGPLRQLAARAAAAPAGPGQGRSRAEGRDGSLARSGAVRTRHRVAPWPWLDEPDTIASRRTTCCARSAMA
jgi:zinc protease